MDKHLVIITGGIGSGKSTLCSYLKMFMPGHALINYDKDVTSVCWDNPDIQAKLMSMFGTCERAKVRDIVFSSEEKMSQLNTIVGDMAVAMVKDIILHNERVIFEIPLLFEIFKDYNQNSELTRLIKSRNGVILTVDAMKSVQIERVMSRNGYTKAQVEAIIAKQSTPDQRREISDYSIDTTDTAHEDMREVAKFVATLLKE